MFPFISNNNNNNGNCGSDDHQQALYNFSPLLVPNYDGLELQDHELIFLQHNDNLLLHHDPPPAPQPLRATTSYDATLSHQTSGVKIVDCPNKNFSSGTDQEIPDKKRHNSCSSRRRGDRHSKINTAQGPRDRRIRLSVKIARDLFDLQDKLGFDRASETVEWLLIQARTEIKKLSAGSAALGCQIGTNSAASSTSAECEAVLFEAKPTARCVKKVMRRTSKSTVFAKESREKARARARERTKEKLWSRRIIEGWDHCEDQGINNNLNQSDCWNFPFQTGQESAMIQSHSSMNNPYLDVLSFHEHEQEQLGTAGPNGIMNMADHEYSVEIMGKWSPSFSNHEQNPARIPQDVSGEILLHHQLRDFESWYKMWEAFVQLQN